MPNEIRIPVRGIMFYCHAQPPDGFRVGVCVDCGDAGKVHMHILPHPSDNPRVKGRDIAVEPCDGGRCAPHTFVIDREVEARIREYLEA